jgi:Xaa-Pro aminopeptidase
MKEILILKKKFKIYGIDGYVVPKNDEFFGEYSKINRLQTISKFTGSAGLAVILKTKNFLFLDGRYTIQGEIESGKNFKIISYEKIFDCNFFKNLTLGIDPKLFTKNQIKKFFLKNNKIKCINQNLIDEIKNKKIIKSKPFYSLDKKVVGEHHRSKIKRISEYLIKNKSDYIFVSAPENVAWILNIRGFDTPNSPIPNCRLIISKEKKIFLICEKEKIKKLVKEKKINLNQIISPNKLKDKLKKLKGRNFIIDKKTCSIFFENLIKLRFNIVDKADPTYLFKSIKNIVEIKNMINAHILDGVALTKFIYWIKVINKKKISEIDAQKKLEKFRKRNKKYLFPSFDTIAGAGENGAIVHYRAKKSNAKMIDKDDIFLCDSGGQYKYGTTDVTRTLCFKKPKKNIQDIFTKVLKGHIAVVKTNLNKYNTGNKIDLKAREFLKKDGLDYSHGTGHGVGYFLNVHEGPQSISKFNKIKILPGMVISNEPGYYKKGHFGIRIENLIYVKKNKKNIFFENLTLAPIEKDLINFNILNHEEQKYLFKYHLDIYSKLSKYLSKSEKKWLASFI